MFVKLMKAKSDWACKFHDRVFSKNAKSERKKMFDGTTRSRRIAFHVFNFDGIITFVTNYVVVKVSGFQNEKQNSTRNPRKVFPFFNFHAKLFFCFSLSLCSLLFLDEVNDEAACSDKESLVFPSSDFIKFSAPGLLLAGLFVNGLNN